MPVRPPPLQKQQQQQQQEDVYIEYLGSSTWGREAVCCLVGLFSHIPTYCNDLKVIDKKFPCKNFFLNFPTFVVKSNTFELVNQLSKSFNWRQRS